MLASFYNADRMVYFTKVSEAFNDRATYIVDPRMREAALFRQVLQSRVHATVAADMGLRPLVNRVDDMSGQSSIFTVLLRRCDAFTDLSYLGTVFGQFSQVGRFVGVRGKIEEAYGRCDTSFLRAGHFTL